MSKTATIEAVEVPPGTATTCHLCASITPAQPVRTRAILW
jgi:hypothetical protein